jgi:hypothetical protein
MMIFVIVRVDMLSFVVNTIVLLIVVNAEYQHAVCCCYV